VPTVRQLSGVDAMHVLEENPSQHMHTVKIVIVGSGPDGPLETGQVEQWARERLPQIPALRWVVHKIPGGLGRPVFVDAGPIDVGRHLRFDRLSEPSDDALDEAVSRIASIQLPRDRPLWELTVLEGLPDDAVALVFKIHHAIMDGQASVRFLELVFDSDIPLALGPVPGRPEPTPTRSELVRFALTEQARLYSRLPAVVRRSAASVRDNRARKSAGAPPVVNPMSGPSTRFNQLPRPDRVYIDVTVPWERIVELKNAAGATVNEFFVALCGGAVRRYLAAHGELPDRCLNVAHPVSLRRPEEIDDFGNRTSYWYVSLGTDVADPIERLVAVRSTLAAAREWAQGDTELFAVWQDYYLLFGTITLKTLAVAERLSGRPLFNGVVSNVRGPSPLSLEGAPVVAVRSMGPLTRVLGLNLTAWSYADTFSIGIQSCRDFMPDLRTMGQHIHDELDAFAVALERPSHAEEAV
jgi:diacylglycerol O-acyltransferase / wax synthase